MSGDYCDIHPSLDQLRGYEDVYDIINSETELVRGVSDIKLSELPGIIFWDGTGRNEYVSFSGRDTFESMRDALRVVFEAIRQEPSLRSIEIAGERIKLTTSRRPEVGPTFTQHIYSGGNIAQGTNVTQNAGIPLPELIMLLRDMMPKLDLGPERSTEFRQDIDVMSDSSEGAEKRLTAINRIKAALLQGSTQLGAAVIVDALQHLSKTITG